MEAIQSGKNYMNRNMKIVVLDGYTLNPGDLTWDALAQLGDLTVHDRTNPRDLFERSRDAEVLLTNKTILAEEHFAKLPELRYIGVLATGYNVVDVEAAKKRNITVTNVPTYGTQSVAQMVFAHLLNLCHHVAEHAQTTQKGEWCSSKDFCYWDFPLIELADKTMGLVGLGRIGMATARLALEFGMKVIAYDIALKDSPIAGVKLVELNELFVRSDVISLHCPLTPQTENIINAESLGKMKPEAFLINTGRGPLVDESALAEALNKGEIAAAGLDVLSVEPPQKNNPLLQAKNCYITPHIAWATRAARKRLLETVIENVKAFKNNSPVNVVNE